MALSTGAVQNATAASATYNWNGLYIGGHAGWGFNHAKTTGFNTIPNPFEHGSGSNELSWDGFTGGGQIGFNWMVLRNVILGIEADFSFADLKSNSVGISSDGISYKTSNMDRFGTVRGRVGYAFNNWLVYGTGGFAWTHVALTNTQGPCFQNFIPSPCGLGFPPTALGATDTNSINQNGWTIGGGIEVGITSNWTAKVEYLHMDFGTFNSVNPSFNRTNTIQLTTNVVRLGLNYKFGGP